MIKKCLQCEKYFEPIKNNYTRFCSKKCNYKNWTINNSQIIKEKRAKYYLENIEKERNNCKKWYEKNKKSEIIKNKEYRKQNRELFDWYHNRDRFGGMKNIILDRDKRMCRACYTLEKIVIHHKDGSGKKVKDILTNNDIKNLITLCSYCHSILHHWQRKNHILLKDEDIVRTLKKLREARNKI